MVTIPTIFNLIFDTRACCRSGQRQSARISKKLKGGLDQYGAECFVDRLIIAAIRKKCETERVKGEVERISTFLNKAHQGIQLCLGDSEKI